MTRDQKDNVTPIWRRELSARAKELHGRIDFAREIGPVIERDYVIKGWLDRNAISVVYGDSNVGKSFWAIDVAQAVHQGTMWNDCRTRAGAVLYCAAEGGAMFANRLVARKASFMVLQGPLNLAGPSPQGKPLSEIVQHLAEVQSVQFSLVVIDILARVMGGADENTSGDVSALIRSAEIIRDETGAHVMFVHHTGKDAARGARGHSSLRAAVDTEVELSKSDGDLRLARTTKQRDQCGGAEHFFELKEVRLGTDSDGDPVTSCIVQTREEKRQSTFRV
ncbi:AAA family ATPase [Aestuariibius sp. 2305UL40-4]|uniref:AAA family ATPase n=1 Tax=Aestuariibius violaceus TaxID=3234132 RepID=UPI00345E6A56